ncbi:MAG: phosphate ABC transporter permease PstA, partial [Calditrichae bacterium]|nr:phosphate ABC transporter permease PstA [Calditrichia bacterium]
ERYEYGNYYGYIRAVNVGDSSYSDDLKLLYDKAGKAHRIATENRSRKFKLERELNDLIIPLSQLQREISLLEIENNPNIEDQLENLKRQATDLEKEISEQYLKLSDSIQKLTRENRGIYLKVESADGRLSELSLSKVVRFYQTNDMNVFQKSFLYVEKLWEFVSANPRESNTEGGVFPAIFGTVLMVLLMSIAVVPFGVLAALYLNEYAKQGTIIRLIRLSVNNLAGVPSIVFGIFGLGFFIYMVGGTIDQVFFSDKLPEPTFGTGGILWASLTLALLTLPVVVVATEEGILAVPRANKEGALALGATRWQMVRKIILPNAMPGILTGLILAISRGAGEVAPLMITGVVKLAPSLALDGIFPFLHLDRKFMHLGFHIYDVGFQSPNVEAAKPMVYTTALLLILLVVCLNLLAIYMRNRLRKKYKTSVF